MATNILSDGTVLRLSDWQIEETDPAQLSSFQMNSYLRILFDPTECITGVVVKSESNERGQRRKGVLNFKWIKKNAIKKNAMAGAGATSASKVLVLAYVAYSHWWGLIWFTQRNQVYVASLQGPTLTIKDCNDILQGVAARIGGMELFKDNLKINIQQTHSSNFNGSTCGHFVLYFFTKLLKSHYQMTDEQFQNIIQEKNQLYTRIFVNMNRVATFQGDINKEQLQKAFLDESFRESKKIKQKQRGPFKKTKKDLKRTTIIKLSDSSQPKKRRKIALMCSKDYKKRYESIKIQYKALQDDIALKQKKLGAYQSDITNLQNQLQNARNTETIVQIEMKNKDIIIQSKETDLVQAKKTIMQQETALNAKDIIIKNKAIEINENNIQYNNALIAKDIIIQDKESKINEIKTEAIQYEKALIAKDIIIEDKETKINRIKTEAIQYKEALFAKDIIIKKNEMKLNQTIREYQERIDELNQLHQKKSLQIENLNKQIIHQAAIINANEKDSRSMTNEINRLNEEMHGKINRIHNLNTKRKKYEKSIDEKQKMINEQQERINELKQCNFVLMETQEDLRKELRHSRDYRAISQQQFSNTGRPTRRYYRR